MKSTGASKFEPGTIVRFVNMIKCTEMNNSYGIVKSSLENGKLRVMINSKNVEEVKEEFCKPIIQCLNTSISNVPCMIWTRSSGETIPRVHWLYDAPKDIFTKEAFDKIQFDRVGEFRRWSEYPGELVGEDNAKKTISYLKETLNWEEPKLKAFLQHQITFMLWHDSASTAKPNHVLNTIINSVNKNVKMRVQNDGEVTIRGPVMYFEYCKMHKHAEFGTTTINSMMSIKVSHAENFQNRMNISEEEIIHKFRTGDKRIGKTAEFPFHMLQSARICDLTIQQATDSVCKKRKGKQICKNCAKFVKLVTSPGWKENEMNRTQEQIMSDEFVKKLN